MSKTIKNNLFRFVTLRSPQLIEEKNKDYGFVFHPDETQSDFLSAVVGLDDTAKTAALETEKTTFSASSSILNTRKDVRLYEEELYRFSSWLMRNKNALTFADINSNVAGLVYGPDYRVLSVPEETVIWENLIYQTIAKDSVYVREGLIQLLIANKFLIAFLEFADGLTGDVIFTDEQLKEFTRRANANVVISKSLFIKQTTATSSQKVSLATTEDLEKATNIALAKEKISQLETALKEVKDLEVKYNLKYEDDYKTALDIYNAELATKLKTSKPTFTEKTNSVTGEPIITEVYPNEELPTFSFSKTKADAAYLSAGLSDMVFGVLKVEGLDIFSNFDKIISGLKAKIKAANQTVFSNSKKMAKKVLVGGSVLHRGDSINSAQYYISKTQNPTTLDESATIAFAPFDNQEISSIVSNIETDNSIQQTFTDFLPLYREDRVVLSLFRDLDVTGATSIRIYGTITSDTGMTYDYDVTIPIGSKRISGIFALGDPVDPADENSGTNQQIGEIFGVTNLGIADFRRVEQEVCCYVPGEVSHIENILAREYKERSTRSLTSVENISEDTTEREVENLTDTTTTERFEMQSEIASIINEDQAQGFGTSANVSYNPSGGTYSANIGAVADFSSSSSTSDSNLEAQTYAQEVTERAMERIVQKTTSKRTSRILREFEENNKHGFDNTEGDNHVTGVYRWVDKIYKNKLINYGKRLMYEFAIPEPARFFKDAIYKKLGSGNIDSNLILPEAPVHPSELSGGINNASDLNENNYQALAAYYNAEVTSKPLDSITLGKSYAQSSSSMEEFTHSKEDTIKIPEGYYSDMAILYLKGFSSYGNVLAQHGVSGASGVTIQNHNQPDTEVEVPYLPAYTGEFPVSYAAVGMHGSLASIELTCKLSEPAIEQWQNETFKAIMDAYKQRVEEYNALNSLTDTNKEKIQFNPLHNRSIEKKELKRIAIDLLTTGRVTVSRDNYEDGSLRTVNKTEALQKHASTVKFFEQAFDWEIMSYIFYPYFYANQGKWEELFQSTDPLFQGFLQSGMARTIVPVRPGFEDAVNWYMETGELWNGQGLVVDQDDDLYVSVAEEMQTVEGDVEGTWETRLPTALTMLQAGTIGLDVTGLPCNSDCDDFKLFDSDGNEILDAEGNSHTNPIEQTDSLIGGPPATA